MTFHVQIQQGQRELLKIKCKGLLEVDQTQIFHWCPHAISMVSQDGPVRSSDAKLVGTPIWAALSIGQQWFDLQLSHWAIL